MNCGLKKTIGRRAFLGAAASAATLSAWTAEVPGKAGLRPNIIVILSDDQGRGEYSAFGTRDIRTPAIDRICREGTELDNFRASCSVCSPTRASLLTGCFPDRVGVPGVIRHMPDNTWGYLSTRATLLPQILKPAGYHTAIVGKWHLGLESPNTPGERGFDFFHGFLGDMMDDYYTHRRGGNNFMRRNAKVIDPPGHATDLFTQWACEYIEERSRAEQPFFLYLAYNAPHDPIQPPDEWLDKVRRREPQMDAGRAKLAALIEHMDSGIGKVLDTLAAKGLDRDTMVIFTSDNGGRLEIGAVNGPWRGGKGMMYEGSLRVPCAVRWPGRIAPGGHLSVQAATMDIFPTVAEAAGARVNPGIDGVSFLPSLLGRKKESKPRDFYFVRREGGGVFGGRAIHALIRGDWKILESKPGGPRELYNLPTDPRESADLAAGEQKKLNEMSDALDAHIRTGAQVPWQKPH
jgi:arylsulfatase A-like enzyme